MYYKMSATFPAVQYIGLHIKPQDSGGY